MPSHNRFGSPAAAVSIVAVIARTPPIGLADEGGKRSGERSGVGKMDALADMADE